MSDFCHHGEYKIMPCKTCKLENDTPVGDWYLYAYNTSDRYEVPDQATIYERREDVRLPKEIIEIRCGYVPDGRKIVEAYNKMTKRLRELEGKT
jgi:hypothetical protein